MWIKIVGMETRSPGFAAMDAVARIALLRHSDI